VTDRPRIGVIIPAYNEEATVGEVVAVASSVRLVDELVVVDDGSEDGTARVAAAHGARVVAAEHRGKGETLLAGARATDAEILVLLDADLTGLRPDHVDKLARTVADEGAAMALGLFDRGPWLNWVFLRLLPRLTGERALRRDVLLSLDPADARGYRIEAALNSRVAEQGGAVRAFVLDGMFHRTKEEKEGSALGFVHKLAMLSVAGWEYFAYWLRRLY
jgi:glycosyltransferase involved in cell wall biosynthesis